LQATLAGRATIASLEPGRGYQVVQSVDTYNWHPLDLGARLRWRQGDESWRHHWTCCGQAGEGSRSTLTASALRRSRSTLGKPPMARELWSWSALCHTRKSAHLQWV